MSRLEDLSPDLQAVLSLLLARRKGYAEIAGMLSIEERAVHDRAHAALALLAPRQARELTAAQREQVGEYLLGQTGPAQRSATRAHLEGSASAGEWARALAAELAPLATAPLPEIPASRSTAGGAAARAATPLVSAPPTTPAENRAPASPTASTPSSRRGGAIVLGVLGAIVIVGVVLIVSLGGESGGSANPTASSGGGSQTSSPSTASAPSSTTAGSSTSTTNGSSPGAPAGSSSGTTTGTSTTGPQPKYGKPMALSPPASAPSEAKGAAFVITLSGRHAFYTFIKGLPAPTGGALYAVWLENSPTEAIPLGSLAAPTSSGLVEGGGPLPSNAGSFHHILITRETSKHPTHPGQTVLGGSFTLG